MMVYINVRGNGDEFLQEKHVFSPHADSSLDHTNLVGTLEVPAYTQAAHQ
jgi:hypothetical protein